jgi:hypothetical protein
MLSSDSAHLLQRSRCVERFARAFGAMPLRAVEFRVDPLLYKVTRTIFDATKRSSQVKKKIFLKLETVASSVTDL